MILVVDNYKTFIGKESNRFKLLTENEKEEYSADVLKQILVVKASSISRGAIKLAMETTSISFFWENSENHMHESILAD